MTVVLTQGRDRYCKDSISGVKEIWLTPFVSYPRYQIITDGVFLIEMPPTSFHQYVQADDANFSEPQQENEGGKFYQQNLTFALPMILDGADAYAMNNLVFRDFRVLIKDRNDNYRILGLYNGITVESIAQVTGGGKADFNGYNIIMKGEEENAAHFITDLDDAGITFGFLLLETGDYILLEHGGRIIL